MAKLGSLFPEEMQPKNAPRGRGAGKPDASAPAAGANGGDRTEIAALEPGQVVEGVYLVKDASLRAAKNGSKYIQATFCDKSGMIPVRHWDATDADNQAYQINGYVKVRGRVETYQNRPQMIVFNAQLEKPENVASADFLPVSTRPMAEMEKELDALLATFTDPDYKRLLDSIFSDEKTRAAFTRSPAANAIHHAWVGGLMEHVLSACQTAEAIAKQRPFLNRDLLMAGVILHDIGKTEELDAGPGFGYTDTGKLCGHIVLGVLLVERHILKLKDFPQTKRDLIQHMILSHHGTREFGSPVTPLFGEAVALHHLECLDAKVQGIQSIIENEEERGNTGDWSDFARVVDGRIYKKANEEKGRE